MPGQPIQPSAFWLEDPQRLRRKLHVISLVLEQRTGIGPHAQLALGEKQLPSLADIHLCLERHENAVGPGSPPSTTFSRRMMPVPLLPAGAPRRAMPCSRSPITSMTALLSGFSTSVPASRLLLPMNSAANSVAGSR